MPTVWICCTLLLAADLSPLLAAEARPTNEGAARPNVIVVLTDDAGWGDLSLHGNPNLSTPNLDQMAAEGAQMKHFYVCAVCSPTRAELLTGRYHARMGVYSTSAGGERFDLGEETIAERFRDAGYQTAAYGKWHSGMQWPYHPNARGFDDFYGFCSGHWGNYFDPMLEHNGRIVSGKGFLVDDLTDHAIDFMDRCQNAPFFIYLAINTPHSPMQVPDTYWDQFAEKKIAPDPQPANARKENVQHTRAALAMMSNIDDNMGRLLSHLKSRGIDQNTIVVFFNDNGPNGSRFNGGLRGRKGSTHEGGLRSPCLIRYPDRIKPGAVVTEVSGAVDLLPTLTELSGITEEPKNKLDGISHAGMLTGSAPDTLANERLLFSSWKGRQTVRTQRYRMHSNGLLFDIEKDPGEQVDLSGRRPDIASHLGKQLTAWTESLPEPDPERPFPIGHPDAKWTQLPARDATTTGGLERSNRFPNCSYFLNWIDTESEIRWEVEALAEGTYEVQMYYACAADQVGSTVQLSTGDQSVTAVIEKAAGGPFLGKPNDRVPRMEGDVRRWGSMKLGRLSISPGRQTLVLSADEIANEQVAEMRLLMLERVSP
ncbi:MAG: arylsulfatase [Planctomycetota bacterium]